jgi:diaminohydroxyphosphoribosylaminopyrimidine deaminase / 5-amino-6-(5-phosphoribosylamino)uracil reductase
MKRCLQLAQQGLGLTYPNPLVGCVIVKNKRIIGENWHQKAGLPHAEINAFNSISENETAEGATLYVNLEPCSHHGRTPPCADRIILEKIARVVISNEDPNPEVAGRGIQQLRKNGIEVLSGLLHEEGEYLNRRFFTFHRKKRPFIILKWAESADGFIAPENATDAFPVSDANHRRKNHKWRAEEAAILVGHRTAVVDNPRLNIRHWTGDAPLRIAIDRRGSLPSSLHLFDGSQPTWILSSDTEKQYPNALTKIYAMHNWDWLNTFLSDLYTAGIQSIIVEGGALTLEAFITRGLFDEIRRYRNESLRIHQGVKAPKISM